MAQTKRKRRSKHRGTAAGTIETRGRTGRPPSPEERKKQDRATARERRLNRPPTWKGSAVRGALAASVMFAFILITTRGKDKLGAAVLFAVFAFLLYVVAGYWLESYLFRRRQRKKLEAK
jgi:Flp pilus assembly protein TadB